MTQEEWRCSKNNSTKGHSVPRVFVKEKLRNRGPARRVSIRDHKDSSTRNRGTVCFHQSMQLCEISVQNFRGAVCCNWVSDRRRRLVDAYAKECASALRYLKLSGDIVECAARFGVLVTDRSACVAVGCPEDKKIHTKRYVSKWLYYGCIAKTKPQHVSWFVLVRWCVAVLRSFRVWVIPSRL